MGPILSGIKQTAKQAAIDTAKQIAREPLEVLRNMPGQAGQTEKPVNAELGEGGNFPGQDTKAAENAEKLKANDKAQAQRAIGILEREIEDIRRQKYLKDIQKKIESGEEVYLTDRPDLSDEQKRAFAAQAEAVKYRKSQAMAPRASLQSASKPGRRMGSDKKKGGVKQEQQRVENVKPPSG
jgi:hypothetical protein